MGAGEALAAAADEPYSTELCGGTHVRRTGDIGLFKIVGEGAIAAGVRRIEALTGEAALAHFHEQKRRLRAAADLLKTAPAELPDRVAALVEERKRLERDLSQNPFVQAWSPFQGWEKDGLTGLRRAGYHDPMNGHGQLLRCA